MFTCFTFLLFSSSQVELAFKQGDVIYVMGEMDEDGFFSGEASGVRGLVPSNFLQPAPLSDEDEVLESASMVSPSRSQGSISVTSTRRSDSLSLLNNVGPDESKVKVGLLHGDVTLTPCSSSVVKVVPLASDGAVVSSPGNH